MGIAITHEQRDLAQSVRAWLTRAAPPEELRRWLDAPEPPAGRPGYWDAAAAQGLLGIHVPEEYGGEGGGLGDLAVVVEEAARALLPGPYLPSVLAAELLHRAGPPHRSRLLSDLAEGRRTGAVALGGTGTLTAVRTDTGHVLDGTAPPVLGAGQADLLLLQTAPPTAQIFGNAAREHMERYGTTEVQLAAVAAKNHLHSSRNPDAQFQDVYTVEEVLAARTVHRPLTKLQCSPPPTAPPPGRSPAPGSASPTTSASAARPLSPSCGSRSSSRQVLAPPGGSQVLPAGP